MLNLFASLDPARPSLFVPADDVTAQEVLRFMLPRPVPPGGPFSFVSVLISPGSYELLSGICSREFNFW